MGRVKLKIKKLENTNGRQSTFAKRKNGILKKANELSILCDIDIVLLMFSPTGKAAICCGTRRCFSFESSELEENFPKVGSRCKYTRIYSLKDLSTQARILQARISEIHGRLSYWTEPDKINNVEHLGQLEISIRQSLDQLRAHKMQDGIQIPLEQQLQSMSWILYFGTGKSPEMTIPGQETSFLDELNTGQLKQDTSSQQQFTNNNNITAYNPNLHNDMNHHQTLPPPPLPLTLPHAQVYIPMNQREYHMNGFFEAPPPDSSAYNDNTNQTRFGSSSSSLPCSISMFDEYLFSQVTKTKLSQRF
uniref:MADS-box protein AGL30 n=1 Tax=Arabidopsis thaliana TaxID=3702 RepID=Q7X9H8_ARATH|nr:MADS-box protein AGL30 [Arabidopsis thaliana]